MSEEPEQKKSDLAKEEEKILKFWRDNKIFEKSEQKPTAEEFVFYDGPPFATGRPHYGHLLAGTMKDVIPRYQTMKGKRVRRRWGWDCHGLPLENVIEAELGLKTKKDILDFGIDKFNQAARQAVLRYADDWRRIVPRLGRWVDMDNDYKTMDASYTESVWWVFKTLHDRGLIYEGYKPMHLCPRCETTLANFEVNQGYKEVKDLAITVEFELVDQPNTYLLAWTTTPWTLPGNVALAVNPAIEYAAVAGSVDGKIYILAAARIEKFFGGEPKILEKFPGRNLIGRKYKPVFDYYFSSAAVYGADFVTTEDGTGIVHLAPAFGDDDYELAKRENLPLIQNVGLDGRFKPEVKDFAGQSVKPKDRPEETDVAIIKYLAGKNLLFAKEKITHAYPHCWRCEAPLLNYAAQSWFVKVSGFREALLAANQEVVWIPEHLKVGRFGKWLAGARDWAISRSRFWGAPLPVWKCADCQQIEVIGTLAALRDRLPKPKNNYLTIRHGQATSNVENRVSSRVSNPDHLTALGVEEVEQAITGLRSKKINLIVSSDFLRTKETAELIAAGLGLDKNEIIFDERLREINAGDLEGHDWAEYDDFFSHHKRDLDKKLPQGESLFDVRRRLLAAIFSLEKKYEGKNILIVSHGLPIFSLLAGAAGVPDEDLAELNASFGVVQRARPDQVAFYLYPRNENGSLDLHRPFIDEVELDCSCGGVKKRVPEVFDCWFESGAMPFGQANYKGEPLADFDPAKNIGWPADFIAEGLDQTRGWFYVLLVLGVALFKRSPYRQVVVNGLVLAADGQKMSKRLNNYPDPLYLIDRYGADALRFYLMQAPVVRAEDLNFSELGVGEVSRKIVSRLLNVLNFYQTYTTAPTAATPAKPSANLLDRWIISRLNQTNLQVTQALDRYELDRAARGLTDLIDDLSNWYLRRSRERFKSEAEPDRAAAGVTIKQVLLETAKLLAPFTPFLAERVFQTLKSATEPESVHLADWPIATEIEDDVLSEMAKVINLAETALARRSSAGVKVRQPLALLKLKTPLGPEYLEILSQELNVKKIVFDPALATDLELDFNLTPELKAEGQIRELTRRIQDQRKAAGAAATEEIILVVSGNQAARDLFAEFETVIKRATKTKEIISGDEGEKIVINDLEFKLGIRR